MIVKAEKTLAAIEAAMAADGGNAYRAALQKFLPTMDDAYRQDEGGFRRHLGASLIGRDCSRELQLKWRWAVKKDIPPRLMRLFNRGHLEEARFLSLLTLVPGMRVYSVTESGGQYKWSDFGGHYGSALDGVATGCPDVPNGEPCYTEFKTSADKGFNETVKKGCREAHYEHYVQMQQCMKYYKLNWSLYMMVNKNNDDLYAEIITYDKETADRYSRRANEIIFTTDALPRISNLDTYFSCKWCDERMVCHGKAAPLVTCRSCAHWSPLSNGTFDCARNNDEVRTCPEKGCQEHVYDPTLLPAFSFMGGDAVGNYSVLRTRDGVEFKQGPDHVTSLQLYEGFNK